MEELHREPSGRPLVHDERSWNVGVAANPRHPMQESLEPKLSELCRQRQPQGAYRARGLIYYFGHSDHDRAMRELTLAAKGLPNDSLVRQLMGSVKRSRGDFEGSWAQMKEAFALNPRNSLLAWDIGQTLIFLRR